MGKGQKIAYIRVSSADQNEERQKVAMQHLNIDKYFIEKKRGKNMDRTQLQEMLEYIREEDVVYVEEFSRLGRSTEDLLKIVKIIEGKGARFVSIKENLDTTTPTGRIAEFEREMILERQREGIAIAKRAGKYRGRKKIVIPNIGEYYDCYMTRQTTKSQAAKELGICRQT